MHTVNERERSEEWGIRTEVTCVRNLCRFNPFQRAEFEGGGATRVHAISFRLDIASQCMLPEWCLEWPCTITQSRAARQLPLVILHANSANKAAARLPRSRKRVAFTFWIQEVHKPQNKTINQREHERRKSILTSVRSVAISTISTIAPSSFLPRRAQPYPHLRLRPGCDMGRAHRRNRSRHGHPRNPDSKCYAYPPCHVRKSRPVAS